MNRKRIYYTSGIAATAVVLMIVSRMTHRPRLNYIGN